MSGLQHLDAILASLDPVLDATCWTWCRLDAADLHAASARAFALIREEEGWCAVVPHDHAPRLGHPADGRWARLTLQVHSSLHAIGLTAVFARALAQKEIPANVVAGLHHDHILVPWARRNDALTALRELAAGS